MFKHIYDKYCPMLYAVAMEITENKEKAEHLLILTFRTAFSNDDLLRQKTTHCITLIRLLIQKASAEFQSEEFFKNLQLKSFENTPFIQRLICGKLSLTRICEESQLSTAQAAKRIREEFNVLRNSLAEGKQLQKQYTASF